MGAAKAVARRVVRAVRKGQDVLCVDCGSGYMHQQSLFDIVLTSRYAKGLGNAHMEVWGQ